MKQIQADPAGAFMQGLMPRNAFSEYQPQQQNNAFAAMAQHGGPTVAAAQSLKPYNALASNGGPTNAAASQMSADAGGLAGGIVEAAQELGMDPVDLATIISYETAGTFDPAKAGPTTQWGQHRGLIQFGEPQAQQYGVDWKDPVGSQLGRGGAVVRYFKDAGFRPGMGLLDAYSAVNAGSVGRYNASDANNGGAPGTVRDKVENQMSAHRAKAISLLGG